MARHAFGGDPLKSRPFQNMCCFPSCRQNARDDLPVCTRHAIATHQVIAEELHERFINDGVEARQPPPDVQPFVYYLRIGPGTVKIGTTRNLHSRLIQLRTSLDYVMAVERGSYEAERLRHRQFAPERLGRNEDFKLTERLLTHIDQLTENTDSAQLIQAVRAAEGRPIPLKAGTVSTRPSGA